MKQHHLTAWAVVALLTLLMAACGPATPAPLSLPTSTPRPVNATQPPATATPAPVATQAPAPSAQATLDAGATPDDRPQVPAPPEDGSRPLAAVPAAERQDRFAGPAETWIEPDKIYIATIVTDKGNIVAELYGDAPQSVNNFVTLALNGFYDGLTFHRVEEGFVIQGGDPAGDGGGGPGYTVPAEIGHMHMKGALAWARTGDEINPERRSSGSQFYITLDPTSNLDGAYTVFGHVIEGLEVTGQIAVGDKITRIDITEGEVKAPASQQGRPLADVPVLEREGYYNTAPDATLDAGKSYRATIKTAKGEIVIDLDGATAPVGVGNFVLLSNLGYFDGMPVAYAVPNEFVLAGSPSGQPSSDVGYRTALEPVVEASDIITGTVAFYPATDPATGSYVANGSQFLITLTALPEAAAALSILGTVVEGLDVANQLVQGDIIESITISEQ